MTVSVFNPEQDAPEKPTNGKTRESAAENKGIKAGDDAKTIKGVSPVRGARNAAGLVSRLRLEA